MAQPTELKGINELRKDGGWFRFDNKLLAKSYAMDSFPEFDHYNCRVCWKGDHVEGIR